MPPRSSVSVAASTAPPARPIASNSARSSLRLGRLGELDVVDDLARAGAAQRVDHARVQRARERPLAARGRRTSVVDRDDRDVARPAARRAAGSAVATVVVLQRRRRACASRGDAAPSASRQRAPPRRIAQPARRAGRMALTWSRGAREVAVARRARATRALAVQVADRRRRPRSRASGCRRSGPSVTHAVPRTVATLSRPWVRKRPRVVAAPQAARGAALAPWRAA